jgi:peptide deformylase
VSIQAILYADHATLRTKAKRVSSFDASLKKLAEDMLETMHAAHGVGLAANQIGVLLQIAVIQIPKERADAGEETAWEDPIYLVNPEVIKRSGERIVEEGCLSLPGYRAKLKRSETVTVKARDLNGKEFRIRNATGLLAQAIEHETDHLNGILYIDHLASLDELYKITRDEEEEEAEEEEAAAEGGRQAVAGRETEREEEQNQEEVASTAASTRGGTPRPRGSRRTRARAS